MKTIVFVLLVSFGQTTVKVDTNFAQVIRAANPKASNYISAVIFYDREYFKKFIQNWKCSTCELIDVDKKTLTTIHTKK